MSSQSFVRFLSTSFVLASTVKAARIYTNTTTTNSASQYVVPSVSSSSISTSVQTSANANNAYTTATVSSVSTAISVSSVYTLVDVSSASLSGTASSESDETTLTRHSTLYVVETVTGSITTSSSNASMTAPPSLNGTNGTCSSHCGYFPVAVASSYWSQYITPAIVGTAIVIVNNATNSTTTSTKYNTQVIVGGTLTLNVSQYLSNGTLTSGMAPSTTQSAIATFLNSSTIYVTYPTPFLDIDSQISWAGTIPYETDGSTVCSSWGTTETDHVPFPFDISASPLPAHPPWPTPTGTVDPINPFGNWYTLQSDYSEELLNVTEIVRLWPEDPFLASIYNCTIAPFNAPASAVQTVSALLATSTAYVSSAASTTADNPVPSASVTAATSASVPAVASQTATSQSESSATAALSEVVGTSPSTKQQSTAEQKTQQVTTSTDAQASSPVSNGEGSSTSTCTDIACFVISAIGGETTTSTAAVNIPAASSNGASAPSPKSQTQTNPTTPQSAESPQTKANPTTASPSAATPVVIGSNTVSTNSQSAIVVGSQTLTPGSTIVIASGTSSATVAVHTSGSQTIVVVNGATTPLSPAATTTSLTPVQAISLGGSSITANSASQFVVGSRTLSPGGSAITLAGQTVSLAASGNSIVVNGKTSPIASILVPTTAAPTIVVAGATVTANSASQFVVGSQTLAPGGSAVTLSGTTFSLVLSGNSIVVNGQTSPIASVAIAATAAPSIVVAGSTVVENSASQYVVGSQTLAPSGPAVTISGTTYSIATSGIAIVVNGQTSAIRTPAGPVIGSQTDLVLGGQTLLPGSSVTVSGTTYSLPAAGSGVFVNGISSQLPTAASGSAVTINGILVTPTVAPNGGSGITTVPSAIASSVSAYIVAGQTLLPGLSIVVSGTTYSLPATGTGVYVNGISTTLPPDAAGTPFSIGNILVTPTLAPDFVIGSRTLLPGQVITVSGVVISAPSGGSEIIVGSSTEMASTLTAGAPPATTGQPGPSPNSTGARLSSGYAVLAGFVVGFVLMAWLA